MDAANSPAIEARGISKHYGPRRALDNVSLAVRAGEIAGLLGPNGAGKTTTLSILSTLLKPDSGEVLISGKRPESDPRRLGRMLGLVPQSLALFPSLSAEQNLWHFARMQGLRRDEARERCNRVLAEVGLVERANTPMHVLSGGMKRLLNLACGVVHRPKILLLDEPTVGVDLQSREQLLARIRRYADEGAAVIYTTHYMEEAERICDRVLLIDHGRLIADGDLRKVIALGGARPRLELTYRGELPEGRFRSIPEVREIGSIEIEGKATLEIKGITQIADLLQRLRSMNLNIVDFSLHSPNLADAFIALTGHNLRQEL
jgi:ABC-2 type transport system ATP-binding protein